MFEDGIYFDLPAAEYYAQVVTNAVVSNKAREDRERTGAYRASDRQRVAADLA